MAYHDFPSVSEPVTNIVLFGRTGNGKSSTGNSIIGQKMFPTKKAAGGVTLKCEMYSVSTKNGTKVNVIDTPGLFDLAVSCEYISNEIYNCLTLAQEGIHAVLLVLSVRNRISQEEESAVITLEQIFGSKIFDYCIVLFTGGDELEEEYMTLDDYLIDGCPNFLKRVLRRCGGRRVVFDNKTTDKDKKAKQVQELLAHVAGVERETGGKPYTDHMHRKIQEEVQRVKREKKEIEEKNIAEAEKEELKKQLDMSYGQNMNLMAQMMERIFKESAAANERQMNMMKDLMELQILGKDAKRKRHE